MMATGIRTLLVRLLGKLVRTESAGGFIMIAFAVLALLWANSSLLSPVYFSLRDVEIGVGGLSFLVLSGDPN